jgi:hypothetical protein
VSVELPERAPVVLHRPGFVASGRRALVPGSPVAPVAAFLPQRLEDQPADNAGAAGAVTFGELVESGYRCAWQIGLDQAVFQPFGSSIQRLSLVGCM